MSNFPIFEKGTIINGYEILNLIGEGGFSQVYRVLSNKFFTEFAAKFVFLDSEEINIAKSAFEAEISMLTTLDHPNIIRLYDHFLYKEFYVLILEYCPGGTLVDIVEIYGPLEGDKLFSFTRQIVSAITYIHSRKIAHHDIKPQNILFDSYGRPKIVDFGISLFMSRKDISFDFRYSLPYAPPELLKEHLFSPYKADYWSLGITLYYASGGQLPFHFKNEETLRHSILNGSFIFSSKIDSNYLLFIKKLLNMDPLLRPSIEEISMIAQNLKGTATLYSKLDSNRSRNSAPQLLLSINIRPKPFLSNHRTGKISRQPNFNGKIPTFLDPIFE